MLLISLAYYTGLHTLLEVLRNLVDRSTGHLSRRDHPDAAAGARGLHMLLVLLKHETSLSGAGGAGRPVHHAANVYLAAYIATRGLTLPARMDELARRERNHIGSAAACHSYMSQLHMGMESG